jgi:hypothetical protein
MRVLITALVLLALLARVSGGGSSRRSYTYDLAALGARIGESPDPNYFGRLRTLEHLFTRDFYDRPVPFFPKEKETFEDIEGKLGRLGAHVNASVDMHGQGSGLCTSNAASERDMLVFLHVPQTGGDSLATLLSWMKIEACSQQLRGTKGIHQPLSNSYNGASSHPLAKGATAAAVAKPVFLKRVVSQECRASAYCREHCTDIVPPRLDFGYAPSPFNLDVHGDAKAVTSFYEGWVSATHSPDCMCMCVCVSVRKKERETWSHLHIHEYVLQDYVLGHMDISVASLFVKTRRHMHVVTMIREPLHRLVALHRHAIHMSNVVLHPWKLCFDLMRAGKLDNFVFEQERLRAQGMDPAASDELHSTLRCTVEMAKVIQAKLSAGESISDFEKDTLEVGLRVSGEAEKRETFILGATPSLRGPSVHNFYSFLRKFGYETYLVDTFAGTLPSSLFGDTLDISLEDRERLARLGMGACSFVGIMEEYQMSMRLLRHKFGLKDEKIDHGDRFKEVNMKGPSIEKITHFISLLKADADQFAVLEGLLKGDTELYHYGYERFDTDILRLNLPEIEPDGKAQQQQLHPGNDRQHSELR